MKFAEKSPFLDSQNVVYIDPDVMIEYRMFDVSQQAHHSRLPPHDSVARMIPKTSISTVVDIGKVWRCFHVCIK